jgi:hypothetical protein
LIGIDKREIYNISMAKFRLLQVRGGGEEEQHVMENVVLPLLPLLPATIET